MFTPQQIDQVSFGNAAFNGYDKRDVDEFLEPLTEDYVTLYKENALLKSKMKVLVSKLEEYRKNEASMRDAIVNAQKTCDMMVKEAEAKCAQMLRDANATAMENAKHADALIVAENARVEDARRVANQKITELQEEINACIQALERIKEAHPAVPAPAEEVPTGENSQKTAADAVADEISANLVDLVGTTEDESPKAAPQHPTNSSTTSKFANLQFGRNYDPTGNGDKTDK